MKIKCPCCGFFTLDEIEPKYDICPVCFWENDPTQSKDPELSGGANSVCLLEGRENYKKYGACEVRLMTKTRAPKLEEMFREHKGK